MRACHVHQLFDAVAAGNVERVIAWLDAGVPVNARDGNGQTPLILACRTGQCAVARLLLARGARLSVRTDPLFGLNEPILAEELRSTFREARASAMAQDILQPGLARSLIAVDQEALNALEVLESTDDLLCEAGPLLTAAVCGHLEVVDVLLRAGADAGPLDWSETPPLVGAASQGHHGVVDRLLAAGADVDAGSGFTALEEAVVNGHFLVVQRLLAAGADVSRRSDDGGTVLMLAAAIGHLHIVRSMVEAGADVDVVIDGESALTCAASYGHLGVYAYLLPRSRPEVQARGDFALGAYLEYVAEL